jgi:hypothetical protein
MGRAYNTNGEKRNANRILVGKQEGEGPLLRRRRRWVDNIKMGLREIGWDGMGWSSCTPGGFSRRAKLHEVS